MKAHHYFYDSLSASTHIFTPDPNLSPDAMTWPFPFTAPCFPLSLENPKVGDSQTPIEYCLTGKSPGPPPSEGRDVASGRTQEQHPGAPATASMSRLSPGTAYGHCRACCSRRAADRDKGSSLDRRSPKGDHGKGSAGPRSRQVLVRLGASALLASTSQTHSNISLFF